VRPYAATFFVFSDYMRPSVRLAALNGQPVIYLWTHDSVGVGEDGPTHQPIEHLMALRAMPNLAVMRPADATEAAEAWVYAMERKDGPTALVLSRQDLPVLARPGGGDGGVARGAYVLADGADGIEGRASSDAPDAILIATGSEVSVALRARQLLAGDGISARVVSMPCWEQFRAQSVAYRESVLPAAVTARVSVEAGVTFGWEAWIGLGGKAVGIDRYGASAPAPVILDNFGITAERVAAEVRALVNQPVDVK
jgi:transketolase